MSKTTVDWPGASGKTYRYWVYPIGTQFTSEPANYIFAKMTPNGWSPVYIGETEDIKERLPNHEKMPCVESNGGTHIHVHKSSSVVQERRVEESDLLGKFNPPCNKE